MSYIPPVKQKKFCNMVDEVKIVPNNDLVKNCNAYQVYWNLFTKIYILGIMTKMYIFVEINNF